MKLDYCFTAITLLTVDCIIRGGLEVIAHLFKRVNEAVGYFRVYWCSVKRRLAQRANALSSAFFGVGLIRERLGDSVAEPLGFFALLSIPQEAGLGDWCGRPSLWYSSPPRRSSCFPAELYPPGGHQ